MYIHPIPPCPTLKGEGMDATDRLHQDGAGLWAVGFGLNKYVKKKKGRGRGVS